MTDRSVYDGVGLRLLAAFLITAMSALVREVSGSVELGQIVFWRSAVAARLWWRVTVRSALAIP